MRYILAGLILMIPLAFIVGYLAGTMENYLWEKEDNDL